MQYIYVYIHIHATLDVKHNTMTQREIRDDSHTQSTQNKEV